MTTRNYRKFDEDFKQGAVALVTETGKPIAQVARELGVNEGTLGNWVAKARAAAGEGNGDWSEPERAELARLRKENTELRMQRDALKRSVALWVDEAMAGSPGDDGCLHRCPEGATPGRENTDE
jgi:transposase